jgi:uncharacterized integral membrane protein
MKISIIVTALIILLEMFIALLINYASSSVPDFIKKYPDRLWLLIFASAIVLVALVLVQTKLSNSSSYKHQKKKITPSQTANFSATIMPQIFKYDVFVSYSEQDSYWVESTFIPALKSHNFSIFAGKVVKGGSLIISSLAEGVEESRRVVAVLTQNYTGDDFKKLESAMAQFTDPGAKARKLIPVLREKFNLPLNLRVLQSRDLTQDDPEEWERLVEDLMP